MFGICVVPSLFKALEGFILAIYLFSYIFMIPPQACSSSPCSVEQSHLKEGSRCVQWDVPNSNTGSMIQNTIPEKKVVLKDVYFFANV